MLQIYKKQWNYPSTMYKCRSAREISKEVERERVNNEYKCRWHHWHMQRKWEAGRNNFGMENLKWWRVSGRQYTHMCREKENNKFAHIRMYSWVKGEFDSDNNKQKKCKIDNQFNMCKYVCAPLEWVNTIFSYVCTYVHL